MSSISKIFLNGATIVQATIPSHISTERYQRVGDSGYPDYEPEYDWVGGYSVSAQVDGTAQASSDKPVFIQGSRPILVGDSTTENDTYSLGSSERYVSGQHSGAKGTVTTGNSKNVYIGGKLVCNEPSSVSTHGGVTTTLSGNSTTTVFIG